MSSAAPKTGWALDHSARCQEPTEEKELLRPHAQRIPEYASVITPDEVQICQLPDGSGWVLGSGTYGVVSTPTCKRSALVHIGARNDPVLFQSADQMLWTVQCLASLCSGCDLTAAVVRFIRPEEACKMWQ